MRRAEHYEPSNYMTELAGCADKIDIVNPGHNKIPLNILCLSSEGSLCKKALSAGVDDVAGRS